MLEEEGGWGGGGKNTEQLHGAITDLREKGKKWDLGAWDSYTYFYAFL